MRYEILLVLSLLGACSPSLSGQLKDPGGTPVTGADARVNVTTLQNGGEESSEADVVICKVDRNGRFAADADLKQGTYLVEALVPGFALSSKTVTLDKDQSVTLVLQPLKKAQPTVIGVKTKRTAGDESSRGAGGATLTPPQL